MSGCDTELMRVLQKATDAELAPLVEYIIKDFNNSLEREAHYKAYQPLHGQYVDLIARELCAFGGNTVVNIFRGGGPEWKTVVVDVADKLDANYEENWPVERIELAVLAAITRKIWKDMDVAQRKRLLEQMDITEGTVKLFPEESLMEQLRSSRFSSLLLASLIANVFASQMLGRTVAITTASYVASRGAATLIGPIGWVATGLWAAFDLSRPAYRITVPAVAHIALLRQRVSASVEVDKAWRDYHRWQDQKEADSWVATLFRTVGLATTASVQRERETAFEQGLSAGRQQATEDYGNQMLKKLDELKRFETRSEAMLAVAFACAQEEGIAPAQVRGDIETCCLGMMGRYLSPALQKAISRLVAAPPVIPAAIQRAIELGIPLADIEALLTVLREVFQQTAAAD